MEWLQPYPPETWIGAVWLAIKIAALLLVITPPIGGALFALFELVEVTLRKVFGICL